MININRRNINDLYTGKNVTSIANSIVATGPDDKLQAPDGYVQPSTSQKTSVGNTGSKDDCGCTATERLAQASGRSIGVTLPKGVNPNNFSLGADGKLKDQRERPDLNNLGLGLWEQLFCRQSSSVSRGSRRSNKLTLFSAALFLRNLGCTGRELTQRLGLSSSDVTVDTRDLQRRTLNSLGGSTSSLSNRDRDVIVRKLSTTNGVDSDNISIIVNGQKTTLHKGDHSGVTSTAALMRAVSGDDSIIDILDDEVEFAIVDTLLENAIEQGIPGAVDVVINQPMDSAYKRRLLVGRIGQAARRSDLTTVKRMVDEIPVGMILSVEPNIVSIILNNYVKPSEKTLHEAYLELTELLTSINNDWLYYRRLNEPYVNLSIVRNITDNAVEVLGYNDDYVPILTLRRQFNREDITTLVNKQYRHLAFR